VESPNSIVRGIRCGLILDTVYSFHLYTKRYTVHEAIFCIFLTLEDILVGVLFVRMFDSCLGLGIQVSYMVWKGFPCRFLGFEDGDGLECLFLSIFTA